MTTLIPGQSEKIRKLMSDPRYWDRNHPDHDAALADVGHAFEEAYPETPSGAGTVHVRSYMRHQDGRIVEVSGYDRVAAQRAETSGLYADRKAPPASPVMAPDAPEGVDVDANIREAARHKGDWLWFYRQVRNKGPWDYKQRGRQFADFGNFNYGAVGTAAGFPENVLLRMAGWAQGRSGNVDPAWGSAPTMLEALAGRGGKPPFGDDPADQEWIMRGIEYFRSHR